MLAIEILMQTVVIVWTILEEQRCRFILAGLVAALNVVRVLCRIAHINPHCFIPTICDLDQMRIEGRAHRVNQIRQWITEVSILPTTEAMTLHNNVTAEALLVLIDTTNRVALIG